MSSSNDESMRHPWDAVIRELIAKGEVPEEVLHDADTIIQWWRSLDPAKQDEVTNRVRELSQGRGVRATVAEKQRHQKESKVTKWYRKPKYIVLGIAILVFCFVPVMDMSYDVVVQKQVEEEYTALEPYEVVEPSGLPETWQTSIYRLVTKYREVTKTRLVDRPVVETRTKRVSILRYLLR